MNTNYSPQALAEAVAVDGFDAHEAAVTAFIAEADRFALSDVLSAVTLDRHQPMVARERAFGRLVAAYCRALEREVVAVAESTGERFTFAA